MDGGRGVGAGHRRADQLARAAIDDDRDVPHLGLEGVAPRALGEVGDQLERVETAVERLLEGQPDRRRLGLGVGRPGQRAVVGHHRLAERHADRDLALVVRLVGVQLRPRRVADDPQAVGQAQPPVTRERRPPGRVDAVVLEPQIVERERTPDREQDDVALGGRAIVELDDVGAVLARRGPRSERPDAGPDGHAVGLERGAQDLGIARVVGGREARPGLDDRRRDAEAGIDLGQLAAGRAAPEDDQAARQLAGQRRLLVGPGDDLVEPLDRSAAWRPSRRR